MTKTATELGRQISEGKLDPVELTESALEKINASDHRNQIFSQVTEKRALEEAKAARKRQKSGDLKSPFDGVPISWKDLFDTRSIPTEAGSPLLKGRIPEKDAKVVERASDAGMVCIGKTHLSELAFSGLGINPNAATSPNTRGTDIAPGGSSSGAAASVAFGFVPLGIGSDTGGSVRIPSAWNDLVGLKTTSGFLPNDGIVPLCKGFDTAGPLGKNVEDAWLMTAIMAGEEPVLPAPKPISECRFLVNRTIVLDGLGEDQKAGFHDAIGKIGSAGASIEFGEIDLFHEMLALGPILFPYEAWQEWGKTIEANPKTMFKPVEDRFRSGVEVTKAQYEAAWVKMLELRQAYEARVADYDAVLCPTVCIGPPQIAPLINDHDLFGKTNLLALRNTRFGNILGLCGLTLPTSRPASGILLNASPFAEKELVSIGLAVEKVIAT